jgi:hypothetical protein
MFPPLLAVILTAQGLAVRAQTFPSGARSEKLSATEQKYDDEAKPQRSVTSDSTIA